MKEEDKDNRQEREFYRQLDDLFNDEELLQIFESKVDRMAAEETPAVKPSGSGLSRFRWGLAGSAAACLLVISLTIGFSESEFRTVGDSEDALAVSDTTAMPRLISMVSRNDIEAPVQDASENVSPESVATQGQPSVTTRPSARHSRKSSVKVIRVEDESSKFRRMLGEFDTNITSNVSRRVSESRFYIMPSSEDIYMKINEISYPGGSLATDATSIMEQAINNIRNI